MHLSGSFKCSAFLDYDCERDQIHDGDTAACNLADSVLLYDEQHQDPARQEL